MSVIRFSVFERKSGFVGVAFTEVGIIANTTPKKTKKEAMISLREMIRKGNSLEMLEVGKKEMLPSFVEDVVDFVDGLWRHEKPKSFPKVKIDWRFLTKKERKILETLLRHPRNVVITYGELAEQAGLTKHHARFVGNVMAKNPFPLLIPCHLVVRSSGVAGNYGYGTEKKKQLISTEME